MFIIPTDFRDMTLRSILVVKSPEYQQRAFNGIMQDDSTNNTKAISKIFSPISIFLFSPLGLKS
jgi:hypothetical protein